LEEVRLGQSQSKPVKANQAWKRFGTAIDEQEVVKKFLASAVEVAQNCFFDGGISDSIEPL
jgi:hypothetical protein